ncbi:MAG TPA: hemerythrin domain-containing protein [Thermoanaerobaculia bacterium]|jgi:hypothetical protein|nr:hemerythrin domain-containing protein [Thermoanaerobaculia bacterium]
MRDEPADTLLLAQRALRSRFDDFRQALQRNDRTALHVALLDFEEQFRRWTETEEKTLVPALTRNGIPGRDPRRELRLEYVQIRELTRYLVRQLGEGIRANDLAGFVENLDRRLRAHESEMERVYYPAARTTLTAEEWSILESARPD